MTGINVLNSEVTGKRLELLRELVPRLVRIAVLVNPADANTETQLKGVNAAAGAMGLQIQVFNADTSAEIDAAFETMGRERPDAVLVATSGFFERPACPTGPSGNSTGFPQHIRCVTTPKPGV
jgi:putative ABC transport system substrate-binding protein